MKQNNEPILLSGRVSAGGLLGYDRPDLAVPDAPGSGDLKLVAVSSERAGKGQRARLQHYTGFFSACVFDGKRWRKFNLRAGAAVNATYVSNGDRKDKLSRAVTHLKTLRGRTAVWGQEGYEVRALRAAAGTGGSGRSAPARTASDGQPKGEDGKQRETKAGDGEQLLLFR
jgi:hypothetical protein